MKGMLFFIAAFFLGVGLFIEWNQPLTMRNVMVVVICGLFGWYFLNTDLKEK